jgi:hypothetical protein
MTRSASNPTSQAISLMRRRSSAVTFSTSIRPIVEDFLRDPG